MKEWSTESPEPAWKVRAEFALLTVLSGIVAILAIWAFWLPNLSPLILAASHPMAATTTVKMVDGTVIAPPRLAERHALRAQVPSTMRTAMLHAGQVRPLLGEASLAMLLTWTVTMTE